MPISAYIFDMDDLLVSTASLWRAAEETLLSALGHQWSPDLAIQYKGMNSLDVAATIHRILRPALSLGQCQKIMRDDLIVRFSGEIHPMPGAVDLVRRLKKTKPMAIASGSPLIAIERATVHLAIRDCFDHLITSESVPRGKPHPDVFLAAARTLNTAPANCLVFEDSLIGVRAAQAAGTKCLSIPSSSHQEIAAIATRVYASLADISDEELKRET